MRRLSSWLILAGIFLFACEGLNLIRTNLEYWIAYGRLANMLICILGLCMTLIGTAFLGGFVYFRDKKRNRLKKRVHA